MNCNQCQRRSGWKWRSCWSLWLCEKRLNQSFIWKSWRLRLWCFMLVSMRKAGKLSSKFRGQARQISTSPLFWHLLHRYTSVWYLRGSHQDLVKHTNIHRKTILHRYTGTPKYPELSLPFYCPQKSSFQRPKYQHGSFFQKHDYSSPSICICFLCCTTWKESPFHIKLLSLFVSRCKKDLRLVCLHAI